MRILLFLMVSVLCNACMDIHAIIDLRTDGSARVSYDIAVDPALTAMMKSNEQENRSNPIDELKNRDEPGITLVSESEYTDEEGRQHYKAVFDVDDVQKLGSAESPVRFSKSNDEISLDIDFPQNSGESSGGQDSKEMEDMARAMFARYKFVYEISMPGAILSTNATSHQDRHARWDYKLSDIAGKPLHIQVRAKSR